MADGSVITFPASILERDDFLVLPLLDDLACDGGPFDQRTAVSKILPVAMEQDVAKSGFIARLALEEVDIDNVAFGDAMLSAACLDNCVSHSCGNLLGKSRAKSHRCAGLTRGNVDLLEANVVALGPSAWPGKQAPRTRAPIGFLIPSR